MTNRNRKAAQPLDLQKVQLEAMTKIAASAQEEAQMYSGLFDQMSAIAVGLFLTMNPEGDGDVFITTDSLDRIGNYAGFGIDVSDDGVTLVLHSVEDGDDSEA